MSAATPIPAPPSLLSPAEESLLEALAQPGADLAALAAARDLTLSALARWLRLPHVRQAFDSLREIFDLQRRLWQEQHLRDAIETLNEVMKVSDAPVERRLTPRVRSPWRCPVRRRRTWCTGRGAGHGAPSGARPSRPAAPRSCPAGARGRSPPPAG